MAAGIGALEDDEYFINNCQAIIRTRDWTAKALKELGFTMLDSKTNFVFAKHPKLPGKVLYAALKERGILVRHFDTPLLTDFNRITIGTDSQMEILTDTIKKILEESK